MEENRSRIHRLFLLIYDKTWGYFTDGGICWSFVSGLCEIHLNRKAWKCKRKVFLHFLLMQQSASHFVASERIQLRNVFEEIRITLSENNGFKFSKRIFQEYREVRH